MDSQSLRTTTSGESQKHPSATTSEALIQGPIPEEYQISIEEEKRPNVDESSVDSMVCRICYDDTLEEPVIAPCLCKGTIGLVHKSCLERWLAESNTNACDLCHKRFVTERTTKYTVSESFYKWLRCTPSSFAFQIRDVRTDIVTCLILTPIALVIIYICLFSADYYNQEEFYKIPAAHWTSLSVMIMGLIILIGYHVWMFLVIRYHSRLWYFWWQRETIVKVYLAPEDKDHKKKKDEGTTNI